MKKRFIKFSDVKGFFLKNPDEFTDSDVIPQNTLTDDMDADPEYWLSEARDQVVTDITDYPGVSLVKVDRESGIEISPVSVYKGDWLDHVSEITHAINGAYEGLDSEEQNYKGSGNDAWEYYGLGGDDDVDYNGSYLDMFAGLITQYVKCKEFSWDELKEVR